MAWKLVNYERAFISIALTFLFLTVLMVFVNYKFQTNSHFSHPQFERFDVLNNQFTEIRAMIMESGGIELTCYKGFFYLDFIWAINLLVFLGMWKYRIMDWQRTMSLQVFIIMAVIAYLFDFLENSIYLNWGISGSLTGYIQTIVNVKKLLYAGCILLPLFVFYFRKGVNYKDIAAFLKSSFFSIIILVIIVLLLTQMPQGGTIIVDLFYSPVNLLIAFLLVNYLALILSHYPAYFKARSDTKVSEILSKFSPVPESETLKRARDKTQVRWSMHPPRILGFGLITYQTIHPDLVEQNRRLETLWRGLGILTYFSWMYVLAFAVKSYLYEQLPIDALSVMFAIGLLWRYLRLLNKKEALVNEIKAYQGGQSNEEFYALLHKTRKFLRFFMGYGIAFLIFLAICATSCVYYQWDIPTRALVFVTAFLNLALYLRFRLSRSLLHYWAFHPANEKVFNKPGAIPFIKDYYRLENDHPTSVQLFFRWQCRLSDHVYYLRAMQFSGIFTLLILLFFNVWVSEATWLNPLNIIIAVLAVGYGIIIVLLKHWIYYSTDPEDTTLVSRDYFMKYKFRFNQVLPLVIIMVVILSFILRSTYNTVHELPGLPESNQKLSLKEYITQFEETMSDSSYVNVFHIASYGGGLKANLWNLLVLNELQNNMPDSFDLPKSFLESSFSFSGVSGGALGLANYLVMNHNLTEDSIVQAIDKVGNLNVLGIDLISALGRDFILEHFPVKKGLDRSYQVMKKYAMISGMEQTDFLYSTYRNYWYEMAVKGKNATIPILLVNSASTGPKQGYGLSVSHKHEFPGSIDIAKPVDGQSPGFYSVVSTSNRFPIFSPSAKIEQKGYFLDGGYFENSGLLSTESLISQVENVVDSFYIGKRKIYINIINGKSDYIWDFIDNNSLDPKKINKTGELVSILQTLTNIDKLPSTIREIKKEEMVEGKDSLISVFLPHLITIKDLETTLKGQIKITGDIIDKIEENNDQIRDVLDSLQTYKRQKWGIVEPPLARLLSRPAVEYQKAMVKYHPVLRDQFREILHLANDKKTDANE